MFDLLTTEEDKIAASQGWAICHVYDLEVTQWVIRILSLGLQPPQNNSEGAGAHVVNLARMGQPVAQKALKLLMHGAPKNEQRPATNP